MDDFETRRYRVDQDEPEHFFVKSKIIKNNFAKNQIVKTKVQ